MDDKEKEKLLSITKTVFNAKVLLMDNYCAIGGREGSYMCKVIRSLQTVVQDLDLILTGGISDVQNSKPKRKRIQDTRKDKKRKKAKKLL